MDLLVGTGVTTALENVQWPKPFLTPAKPLRSGWLFQRIDSSTATTTGAIVMLISVLKSFYVLQSIDVADYNIFMSYGCPCHVEI